MRILGGLLVSLASLLVTGLALELGLRILWDGYYLKERKSYVVPHADLGWVNRPGVSVDFGRPEFSTKVTHDADGFRRAADAPDRSNARWTILALGDSFTYGVGVEDDEAFAARLEALDPALRVVNGGVNNYSTTRELLLLRERGPAVDPDLVLLGFFWNDPPDAYKGGDALDFAVEDGVLRYPPPNEDPVPETFGRSDRRRRARHSYVYRFVSDRWEVFRWRLDLWLGRPVDDPYTLRPEEVEPAWELIEAALVEMDRVSRELGARLVVVDIPDQVLVAPYARAGLLGFSDSDVQVHERLAEVTGRHGIPLLEVLPALREAEAEHPGATYYRKDRHLTALGHRVVAEAIHSQLRTLH